jgi:Flp pilus assembly protein TadD
LQVGNDIYAERKLAGVTQQAPGEPAGWANWGVLALRQRNFDAAAQRLERARELAPRDDHIYYLLGILRGNAAVPLSHRQLAQAAENPTIAHRLCLLGNRAARRSKRRSRSQQVIQRLSRDSLTIAACWSFAALP